MIGRRACAARHAVRSLRAGTPLMLAAVMHHGTVGSALTPLFGVPARTLTSVSHLARLGARESCLFVTDVIPEFRGYEWFIFEPSGSIPRMMNRSTHGR